MLTASSIDFNSNIEEYEYSNFENIKEIGRGASGTVVRANWKSTDCVFALKSFFNFDEITVKKEVHFLKIRFNEKTYIYI